MPITKKNFLAATPETFRGKPVHLGGDPKGDNILYGCGSTVVIRSLKNPALCDTYSEHSKPCTVARYAPSGYYIASADTSGVVKIWDTTQAEHPLKLELKPLSGPILDMVWSDDSKRIVVVGEGREKYGAAFFWDSGASVGEITGHSKAICSVDFKQTRPYRVVTGSEDFGVNWFEGPPFKYKNSLKEHTRYVNCVRFNKQGTHFITVGSDKKGFIYDGKDATKVGELSAEGGHGGSIFSCSWSPDGTRILTSSGDKTSKIWDAASGKCISTFTFGKEVEDQQVGTLWQGDFLISLSLGGDLTYLDPNNPSAPLQVLKGHNKLITSLAFDSTHNHLFTGSYDAIINKWDPNTALARSLSGKGHTNQVTSIRIQGENVVTCGMDDSVRITSLVTGEYNDNKISTEGPPADVAVSQHSDLIVTATPSSIHLIRGGKAVAKTAIPYNASAVAISNDDSLVAVGGKDNIIHIYKLDGTTLTESHKLAEHKGALTSISFSPDGKWMASADQSRDIFVWSLPDFRIQIRDWVYHTARVNDIAWSPNSLFIASASLDQQIIVWSIQDPSSRQTIKNTHSGGVNRILWTDNNTLASAGQDCFLKTWNVTF